MMIYRPEHCTKILRGEKTQTRRLWRAGDRIRRDETGAIVAVERLTKRGWRDLYVVGLSYAVCPGRGKHQVGRNLITQIRWENLNDITIADCYAEGVPTTVNEDAAFFSFMGVWDAINKRRGTRSFDDPKVYALTFEVAK